MGRTVKPYTKAQQQQVTELEVKIANLAVDAIQAEEARDQCAAAAAFAANIADQRLRQLRDVTPRETGLDCFVSVNGEIILRATMLAEDGVDTFVQVHKLDPHDAYDLGSSLLHAADERA